MFTDDDALSHGCILPLTQAAVTGFLVFALAYFIGDWRKWEYQFSIAGICGAATALLVWYSRILHWWRSEHPITEPELQEPTQIKLDVAYTNGGGRHHQLIDLPLSDEEWNRIAADLMHGVNYTETAWNISRAKLVQTRVILLKRGILAWKNPDHPSQGVKLTAAGKAALRHYDNRNPSNQKN